MTSLMDGQLLYSNLPGLAFGLRQDLVLSLTAGWMWGGGKRGKWSQESAVCHLAAFFLFVLKSLTTLEGLRVCFSVLLRGKYWNTAFYCRPGLKLILVRNTKWVVGLKPVFYYLKL